MTSVLITGAAGFVAAHLVRKFRDEGFTVFATDIRVPNSGDPLSQVLDDAHLRTLDLRDGDATALETTRRRRRFPAVQLDPYAARLKSRRAAPCAASPP